MYTWLKRKPYIERHSFSNRDGGTQKAIAYVNSFTGIDRKLNACRVSRDARKRGKSAPPHFNRPVNLREKGVWEKC